MRKLVNLTEKDMRNGKRSSPSSCPLSIAIRRAFKYTEAVSVGATGASFLRGIKRIRVKLPNKAQEFIYKFDRSKPTQPIRFYLVVPGL